MRKIKTFSFFLILAVLTFSCSKSLKEIKEKANKELTINSQNSSETFYVSNIYKDEELGELFWEKSEEEILQISSGKQNISSLLLDNQRHNIIYSQSQKKDIISKILEPITINSPYRFSKYKILSYNLKNNNQTELIDLSKHSILGFVQYMGFLNGGETLAFQTHYGRIYFLEIDKTKDAIQFVPLNHFPNQFKFDDLYNLQTDGNHNIFFKARSGYKSEVDKSFVYNTFKYNINTNKIAQITNTPFFFERKEITNEQNDKIEDKDTIYFDKEKQEWRDKYGTCNTCTYKNGFNPHGWLMSEKEMVFIPQILDAQKKYSVDLSWNKITSQTQLDNLLAEAKAEYNN